MSHVTFMPTFYSVAPSKMRLKTQPLSCQPSKLSVKAIASELRISTRQLARLAKKGVPGVTKGPGGYQFVWLEIPETLAWIAEFKRFRKGNRKRPAMRKERLSKPQLFARLVRRVEKQVFSHLDTALENPTSPGLEELNAAAKRLESICAGVLRRIMRADSNPRKRKRD